MKKSYLLIIIQSSKRIIASFLQPHISYFFFLVQIELNLEYSDLIKTLNNFFLGNYFSLPPSQYIFQRLSILDIFAVNFGLESFSYFPKPMHFP